MIDPSTLTGPVGALGSVERATVGYVPPAWAEPHLSQQMDALGMPAEMGRD